MELQDSSGRCLIKVKEIEGMLVVEYHDIDYAFAISKMAKRPSASPPSSYGTTELWHLRFAHNSKEAVSHIPQVFAGTVITDSEKKSQKGDRKTVCETCALTKSHHQLSRRLRERGVRPFEVLTVDLIHVTNDFFDGSRYVAHAVDDENPAHILMATSTRADLAEFVRRVVAYVEKQTGVRLLKINSDQVTTMTSFAMDEWSDENAIQLKTSAPYTHQQVVAAAERAGQQLCNMARAFHIESKLPAFL